ncbi:MAG: macro domain-containing protein [Anaerolineae bacterium]|nr:macro domain-containing protein [Anaerolineae bacterium]
MLTYVEMELFQSPAQALVNTVNTVGVMGKGIAAVFKKLYPDMYEEYRVLCQQEKLEVGTLFIWRTLNKTIVNFPTKKHWRQRSKPGYIEAGLAKFVSRYADYGISSVSFPQLGCGHGELDWETVVQPLMEHYLRALPIPVYIHLHPHSADFVPERLDVEYAREMRLERQRVSAGRLWQELRDLVSHEPEEAYSLTLFGPDVTMDEEHLFFHPKSGDTATVCREDVEDLWNTLRLRGTLRQDDVPRPVTDDGATEWLFELLKRLEYVQPVTLRLNAGDRASEGLRYDPRPEVAEKIESVVVV